MKKIIPLLLLTLLINSCEREKYYSCVCNKTTYDSQTAQNVTTTTTHPIHDKKKKAEKRCQDMAYKPSTSQVIFGQGTSETCTLH